MPTTWGAGRFERLGERSRSDRSTLDLAIDRKDGREVLVETFAPTAGATSTPRFLDVARSVARLDHAGIPRVVHAGREEDRCFLVTNAPEGPTLRELLATPEARLPARAVALDLVDTVAAAHAAGVAHGDLDGRAVLVTPSGVIVTGWARATLTEPEGREPAPRDDLLALADLIGGLAARASDPALAQVAALLRGETPADDTRPALVRAGRELRALLGVRDEVPPAATVTLSAPPRPISLRRSLGWFGQLALVVLTIGLVTGVVMFVRSLDGPGGAGAPVRVAGVVGRAEADAASRLRAQGLRVRRQQQADPTAAKGTVITQEPPAGASARQGDPVVVVVSTGGARVEVPDVVGRSSVEATAELAKVNLRAVLRHDPNAGEPAGTVVLQTPNAGDEATEGDAVVLIVAGA